MAPHRQGLCSMPAAMPAGLLSLLGMPTHLHAAAGGPWPWSRAAGSRIAHPAGPPCTAAWGDGVPRCQACMHKGWQRRLRVSSRTVQQAAGQAQTPCLTAAGMKALKSGARLRAVDVGGCCGRLSIELPLLEGAAARWGREIQEQSGSCRQGRRC